MPHNVGQIDNKPSIAFHELHQVHSPFKVHGHTRCSHLVWQKDRALKSVTDNINQSMRVQDDCRQEF